MTDLSKLRLQVTDDMTPSLESRENSFKAQVALAVYFIELSSILPYEFASETV